MNDSFDTEPDYSFTDHTPSEDSRLWATGCHIAGLAGSFIMPSIGHILGPLVIWILKKDGDFYVDREGREAINFQISLTIYGLALALLMAIAVLASALLIGIPFVFALLFLAALLYLVEIALVVMAALDTYAGRGYRYPMIMRFL